MYVCMYVSEVRHLSVYVWCWNRSLTAEMRKCELNTFARSLSLCGPSKKVPVCMYVCMYLCMSLCMYVCMYVCMYECMNECMNVCM